MSQAPEKVTLFADDAELPEAEQLAQGLAVERVFSKEGEHPFDSATWERRDAAIKNHKGEAIFEQKDVEFPTSWSLLATNVVASKYFYGDLSKSGEHPAEDGREDSLKQLIHRVTRTLADWGIEQNYFATKEDGERFYDELTWLCTHQYGAFNSPVWFNVGLHQQYGVRDTGGKRISGWDFDKKKGRPGRSVRAPARLGVLHHLGGRLHRRHLAAYGRERSAVQVRQRRRGRLVEAALVKGKTLRRRHPVRAGLLYARAGRHRRHDQERREGRVGRRSCRRSRCGTRTSWSLSRRSRPRSGRHGR